MRDGYTLRDIYPCNLEPVVYLPIGWVFHVEKEIKSGKDEKLTCSLVGLENGYPSAYEVGTCYEALFFSLHQLKIFCCALTHAISQNQDCRCEILGDQIRNFNV